MNSDLQPEKKEATSKKKKRSLGRQCAAYQCYSTFYTTEGTPTGLYFFRFPQKNPEKRRWCNLVKRVDGMDGFNVTTGTVLCEKHFTAADIKRNPNYWRLVSGAEPSQNLFQSSVTTSKQKARKPPSSRLKLIPSVYEKPGAVSHDNKSVDEFDSLGNSLAEELPVSGMVNSVSIATQTDFSFINSPVYLPPDSSVENDDLMKSFIDSTNLRLEVKDLKSKVSMINSQLEQTQVQLARLQKALFSVDKLKDDDSATRFYTGFQNFSALMATFQYLEPKLSQLCYWHGRRSCTSGISYHKQSSSKPGRKHSLSTLEEFLLVLLRLKVGLFVSDLADRFGISQSQVSKIFTTWICFLYHELPTLFPFPSKDLILENMPAQFKEFPKTRIILDCTELFIETPSSMVSQSQTWSEYKHHNTWKALVGISPAGCITFVSKLWSGRVSDKEITIRSGVLNLLEDGDNIMADRGFDIGDVLPPGITLNIPPFKGTRSQLSSQETEETARIASLRIHVERAIGRVKNYHILDGILPLSLYPVADQIFTVCCLLTNFLPCLVQSKEKEYSEVLR